MSVESIAKTSAPVKVTTGEKYLTLADVRQRLQISKPTLYRITHERGLRVIRCGGLVRIAESELQRWLAQHTEGNGEAGHEF